MSESRNTVQKEIVSEALRTMHCHPTADSVYLKVRESHPTISKATVYRILNQMAENGSALRVKVPCGADHFDDTTCPHYHILCTDCGRVEDVEMEQIPFSLDKEHAAGFTVTGSTLLFEGVCPTCGQKASVG